MYHVTARHTIDAVATHRLGASMPAGRALFGQEWPSKEGDRVLYYGLDFRRFEQGIDVSALRRELGLPPDSFVIGHVGRFDRVKNHSFLIEVMTDIAREDPHSVLLLVGEGPLRGEIEGMVAKRRLSGRVVFAGSRPDVPELMRAAMDVLVLPSLYEGLAIVGLEAQAAGLPCLFSSTVPREVAVVPSLTRFLTLEDGASAWARAVLDAKRSGPRRRMTQELMSSPFDIRVCADSLIDVYTGRPTIAHPHHARARRRPHTSGGLQLISTLRGRP